MRSLVIALSTLAVLGSFEVASAQPADVPGLLRFVETQPTDMDRSVWKEKRRDATRKLALSKDKRAVPVLMRLAESETFDIVGEFAIDGLGALGDPQAVPVLQKIANDPARDKGQQALARKALSRLGASADIKVAPVTPVTPVTVTPVTPVTPPVTDPAVPEPLTTTVPPTSGGSLLGDKRPATTRPGMPEFPDDTLAAYERITFTGGAASLAYDTLQERANFDADLAGRYRRRVERTGMAYGIDGDVSVVAGLVNPPGRASTRGAQLGLRGGGEVRFYSGSLYGVGKAALALQVDYISDKDDMDPANDLSATPFSADIQLALGGGYGRMLDVGAAIRVRRLSRVLDAARALGKPIDAATARTLQLTWWALRGERSSHPALVATVAILREAGILLAEPDSGLAYEILTVLRDSQLFLRPSGIDLQIAFGESYLVRENIAEGRAELLLVSAGYGRQLAEDTVEVSGTAYGQLRILTDGMDPAPWAAGVRGRLRRFTYGEHGDPYGALDLMVGMRASDDDIADVGGGMASDLSSRIEAEVGFTWLINQASGLRLAGLLAADSGELFFGARLEATYGFLDATFAGL